MISRTKVKFSILIHNTTFCTQKFDIFYILVKELSFYCQKCLVMKILHLASCSYSIHDWNYITKESKGMQICSVGGIWMLVCYVNVGVVFCLCKAWTNLAYHKGQLQQYQPTRGSYICWGYLGNKSPHSFHTFHP